MPSKKATVPTKPTTDETLDKLFSYIPGSGGFGDAVFAAAAESASVLEEKFYSQLADAERTTTITPKNMRKPPPGWVGFIRKITLQGKLDDQVDDLLGSPLLPQLRCLVLGSTLKGQPATLQKLMDGVAGHHITTLTLTPPTAIARDVAAALLNSPLAQEITSLSVTLEVMTAILDSGRGLPKLNTLSCSYLDDGVLAKLLQSSLWMQLSGFSIASKASLFGDCPLPPKLRTLRASENVLSILLPRLATLDELDIQISSAGVFDLLANHPSMRLKVLTANAFHADEVAHYIRSGRANDLNRLHLSGIGGDMVRKGIATAIAASSISFEQLTLQPMSAALAHIVASSPAIEGATHLALGEIDTATAKALIQTTRQLWRIQGTIAADAHELLRARLGKHVLLDFARLADHEEKIPGTAHKLSEFANIGHQLDGALKVIECLEGELSSVRSWVGYVAKADLAKRTNFIWHPDVESDDGFEMAKATLGSDARFRALLSLDGFEHMTSLKFVTLRGNKVDSIDPLGHLPIQRLDLEDNTRLRTIDAVVTMSALHDLNLSRTNVADLQPLLACPSLRQLTMRRCALSEPQLNVIQQLKNRGVDVQI